MLPGLIYVLGILLMVLSVIGYAFRPPPGFVASEGLLKSTCLYYTVFAFFLFVQTALECTYLVHEELFLHMSIFKLVFLTALILALLHAVNYLKRVWEFEVGRIKDALMYGSIVYLLGKDELLRSIHLSYLIDAEIIALVLSLFVAILSIITLHRLKKLGFFFIFENLQLVQVVFLLAFFTGLSLINSTLGVNTLSYMLAITLNAYALYTIFRLAKPVF
ncbi:hypothetical protein [Archaeoglobus veneficus]|uniref:Uncharacterized protein n=1 Tax=Archaeoglobus veneficus (strain DSM 11195 / SNP6) TaxID=693661 RepID=F2KSQ7_ARCVS|nr:hypothetical protein [Archaeoglobus veneficus]AEA46952.1 hypothetical protein Arcve_0941 [Archaeoglobus veneficus SNP6]